MGGGVFGVQGNPAAAVREVPLSEMHVKEHLVSMCKMRCDATHVVFLYI